MQLPDNNTYYDITIDNKLENVVKNDAPDLAVDALMRAIGKYQQLFISETSRKRNPHDSGRSSGLSPKRRKRN